MYNPNTTNPRGGYKTISRLAELAGAMRSLELCPEVALDFTGPPPTRMHRVIAGLLFATSEFRMTIYVDILALLSEALGTTFDLGSLATHIAANGPCTHDSFAPLSMFLTKQSIVKVTHNSRGISQAMTHLIGVRVTPLVDIGLYANVCGFQTEPTSQPAVMLLRVQRIPTVAQICDVLGIIFFSTVDAALAIKLALDGFAMSQKRGLPFAINVTSRFVDLQEQFVVTDLDEIHRRFIPLAALVEPQASWIRCRHCKVLNPMEILTKVQLCPICSARSAICEVFRRGRCHKHNCDFRHDPAALLPSLQIMVPPPDEVIANLTTALIETRGCLNVKFLAPQLAVPPPPPRIGGVSGPPAATALPSHGAAAAAALAATATAAVSAPAAPAVTAATADAAAVPVATAAAAAAAAASEEAPAGSSEPSPAPAEPSSSLAAGADQGAAATPSAADEEAPTVPAASGEAAASTATVPSDASAAAPPLEDASPSAASPAPEAQQGVAVENVATAAAGDKAPTSQAAAAEAIGDAAAPQAPQAQQRWVAAGVSAPAATPASNTGSNETEVPATAAAPSSALPAAAAVAAEHAAERAPETRSDVSVLAADVAIVTVSAEAAAPASSEAVATSEFKAAVISEPAAATETTISDEPSAATNTAASPTPPAVDKAASPEKEPKEPSPAPTAPGTDEPPAESTASSSDAPAPAPKSSISLRVTARAFVPAATAVPFVPSTAFATPLDGLAGTLSSIPMFPGQVMPSARPMPSVTLASVGGVTPTISIGAAAVAAAASNNSLAQAAAAAAAAAAAGGPTASLADSPQPTKRRDVSSLTAPPKITTHTYVQQNPTADFGRTGLHNMMLDPDEIIIAAAGRPLIEAAGDLVTVLGARVGAGMGRPMFIPPAVEPCRYFFSPRGCREGGSCHMSHQSMPLFIPVPIVLDDDVIHRMQTEKDGTLALACVPCPRQFLYGYCNSEHEECQYLHLPAGVLPPLPLPPMLSPNIFPTPSMAVFSMQFPAHTLDDPQRDVPAQGLPNAAAVGSANSAILRMRTNSMHSMTRTVPFDLPRMATPADANAADPNASSRRRRGGAGRSASGGGAGGSGTSPSPHTTSESPEPSGRAELPYLPGAGPAATPATAPSQEAAVLSQSSDRDASSSGGLPVAAAPAAAASFLPAAGEPAATDKAAGES